MADGNMSKPALMAVTLVAAFGLGWFFSQPGDGGDVASADIPTATPAATRAATNAAPSQMNNNAPARNQAPPPITQVPQRDDGSASSLDALDLDDPAVQQDLDRLLADRSRQLQQQQAERAMQEWRNQMPQAVGQVLSDIGKPELTNDVVSVLEDMDTQRELFVEEDMADGEPDFEAFEAFQQQMMEEASAELLGMLGEEGFEELQRRVPPGPVPPAPPGAQGQQPPQ